MEQPENAVQEKSTFDFGNWYGRITLLALGALATIGVQKAMGSSSEQAQPTL